MSARRILSLWFPRLAAERVLRIERGTIGVPMAVLRDERNMQVLSSLSVEASAAGLIEGQSLRDARAMCPELVTRRTSPHAEAAFLAALRRWAEKFSPWVADIAPASLVIDLTGCAHLFGGELGVVHQVEADCADLALTVRVGVADTLGAAWALARYSSSDVGSARNGDAIDQEAYATRSRAAKRRHWERGGAAPVTGRTTATTSRIAAPGHTHSAIGALPVAALRLPPETVTQLGRLGLRRIDELAGQPRAALSRRFGRALVLRLDQALGMVPEPISPVGATSPFAVRLTLPEPIGLESDIAAGLDRLLPALEERLRAKGQGARRIRLQALRCDHTRQTIDVGLARPSAEPDRIRPLLLMKLIEIDAGPGIDVLRLEASVTEPVHASQLGGHMEAARHATARASAASGGAANDATAMEDLLGRLGARIGLDVLTRLAPADSHIPEKATQVMAAAWSAPSTEWPNSAPRPRPLILHRPEHVTAPDGCGPTPPAQFRWRRRNLTLRSATGPERIAPEWWLDEPEWRSGQRDYWRVETETGERLWLYYAHGGTMSGGWFCQGTFA